MTMKQTKIGIENPFDALAEELAREEVEGSWKLLAAGRDDLLQKVRDGEITMQAALLIFDRRRP